MPISNELIDKLQRIQLALRKNEELSRQRLELLGFEALKAFDTAISSVNKRINVIEEIRKQKASLKQWKIGFFHSFRPILRVLRHFLSMPVIYYMIIPSVLLHISLELYQQICFRLYGIPRVRARNYFTFDRVLLPYLNLVEKIHCVYCSYVNNLFQFAVEIGGRTERYWCPIKYANHVRRTHSQYDLFAEYLDGETFRKKWETLRCFSEMREKEKPAVTDQEKSG